MCETAVPHGGTYHNAYLIRTDMNSAESPRPVKLTLKLNSGLIEEAKEYARLHGTSLSRLVAAYFASLAVPAEAAGWEASLSPEVRRFMERTPAPNVDADEYRAHLSRKHGPF